MTTKDDADGPNATAYDYGLVGPTPGFNVELALPGWWGRPLAVATTRGSFFHCNRTLPAPFGVRPTLIFPAPLRRREDDPRGPGLIVTGHERARAFRAALWTLEEESAAARPRVFVEIVRSTGLPEEIGEFLIRPGREASPEAEKVPGGPETGPETSGGVPGRPEVSSAPGGVSEAEKASTVRGWPTCTALPKGTAVEIDLLDWQAEGEEFPLGKERLKVRYWRGRVVLSGSWPFAEGFDFQVVRGVGVGIRELDVRFEEKGGS